MTPLIHDASSPGLLVGRLNVIQSLIQQIFIKGLLFAPALLNARNAKINKKWSLPSRGL